MSKGLEALKRIEVQFNQLGIKHKESGCHINEDDYFIIEQELTAYEIIKEKKVNVIILMGCDSLEEYNKHPLSWKKLTQEEWDLLTEVLINGK